MIATPIRTERILPGQKTIIEIVDQYIPELKAGSVLAIASKIVSLCENRIVGFEEKSLEQLVKEESELYLQPPNGDFTHSFTVTASTLIARAGIDKSSKHGYYILWPNNPQKAANEIREFLAKKFGHKDIGVVITDSTSSPLRYGVSGIVLAHSGFSALKKYRYSNANVSGNLAAVGVAVMGEGSEQTPLAVISDVPFVDFQDRNPTAREIKALRLTVEDDYFAFALKNLPWQRGQNQRRPHN